jgi:lysosomal alpha-mannosidase
LIEHLDDRVQHYMTDDIFCLFGDDFEYKAAAWNYRNLDAMIEYMNTHHGDKYKFVYSTPTKYLNALKKQKVAWPTKYDDLFPYATGDTDWWTGYFSSRANAKGYIRRASSNLHSSSIMYAQKMLD